MATWRMLLTILTFVLAVSARAEEKKAPDAEMPAPPVFLDERARGPVVAAQVVLAGNPSLSAAYLRAGLQQGVWMAKPARNPRIDKDLLSGIEHRKPIQNADLNKYEAGAYARLVFHARETPADALAKVARRDVFYANLWEDPQRYVGEPIHITGQMKRLVRMDAPKSLWNDGIKTLYEAWVFPDDKDGDNPYCIVFSELPKNVKPGEKVTYDISCNAYFFKLYRYETKERGKSGGLVRRDAPMFIGRTFERKGSGSGSATNNEEESAWSIAAVTHALPTCVLAVVVMLSFIIGVNWWFRRGDQKVHQRIAGTKSVFVAPPPDIEPSDLPPQEPRAGRFGAGE